MIMNPTVDVLEKRVEALGGGVASIAGGSGQAASAYCIQNLAQAGDNIVASTDLYGGTVNLFRNTVRQQGLIETLSNEVLFKQKPFLDQSGVDCRPCNAYSQGCCQPPADGPIDL